MIIQYQYYFYLIIYFLECRLHVVLAAVWRIGKSTQRIFRLFSVGKENRRTMTTNICSRTFRVFSTSFPSPQIVKIYGAPHHSPPYRSTVLLGEEMLESQGEGAPAKMGGGEKKKPHF